MRKDKKISLSEIVICEIQQNVVRQNTGKLNGKRVISQGCKKNLLLRSLHRLLYISKVRTCGLSKRKGQAAIKLEKRPHGPCIFNPDSVFSRHFPENQGLFSLSLKIFHGKTLIHENLTVQSQI
jgi:hypothetical protein